MMLNNQDIIIDRLKQCSKSFQKKEGRHILKTKDVVYCSFETQAIKVPDSIAQRSARKRLNKFAIPDQYYNGKSVLDLGAHCGAMLFQLCGLGIARGLGVEFDQDKVDMANDIARLSALDQVKFQQGDVDLLSSKDTGRYDIVMALAIESHLKRKERLFSLLSEVTIETLIFEGNAKCDVDGVAKQLNDAGFVDVSYLGFCDDDIRPENNRRPIIVARK